MQKQETAGCEVSCEQRLHMSESKGGATALFTGGKKRDFCSELVGAHTHTCTHA